MALKKCRECGKKVSTSAGKCPNCGKKNPTQSPAIGCVSVVILFLVIGWMCSNIGGSDEGSVSTVSTQSKPSQESTISYTYNASTPEGKIERAISHFATIKRINVNEYADMVTIMYLQTFNAWNKNHVHRKTKEHMHEVLEAAFLYTDMGKVSLAPYYPAEGGGEIAVALLRVPKTEYVKGKDVEFYDGFTWKD